MAGYEKPYPAFVLYFIFAENIIQLLGMNFKLVLKYLAEYFTKNKIPYALIGGLALDLYGIVRTTQDIDVLVYSEDINKIEEFLLSHGYKKLFQSEEVASYISDNYELGRIDFLLAHRKYTNQMLKNAVSFDSENIPQKIFVVGPEDLIGLKLQAHFNRQERKNVDINDIQSIIKQYKSKLDYNKVREYFDIFSAKDLLEKLWQN
jgi:predicted nucleotidyltransferase